MTIVTKQSLNHLLQDPTKRANVIGRALVVLFHNQTQSEQADNTTKIYNDIGFTGADAKSGSLTAKFYLKHGTLLQWQINRWMKPGKSGFPRLCKYHRQLNIAAERKAKEKGA